MKKLIVCLSALAFLGFSGIGVGAEVAKEAPKAVATKPVKKSKGKSVKPSKKETKPASKKDVVKPAPAKK